MAALTQEYERIKTELRRIYEERADGAILRSKTRWIELGEKLNQQNISSIWSVHVGTTIRKQLPNLSAQEE